MLLVRCCTFLGVLSWYATAVSAAVVRLPGVDVKNRYACEALDASPMQDSSKVPAKDSVPTPHTLRAAESPSPAQAAQPLVTSSPGVAAYSQVVPTNAITSRGVMITHRVNNRLLFEIPSAVLNTDLLLVGRYVTTSANPVKGPFPGDLFVNVLVRFELRDDKVQLRIPNYNIRIDSTLPLAPAVAAAYAVPAPRTLPVLAYGPNGAPVIDVAGLLFASPEFSGARGPVDMARTQVTRVVAFPQSVMVEATQSFANGITGAAVWSLIQLPLLPMQPRLADARLGYFSVNHLNFGTDPYRSTNRSYITRWRLEKKDSSVAISEPIQPIVYYVDPATPEFLKPYIKAGVEAWQPAFEAAGFRHAIVAKDPPQHDSTWSMEDSRNTVVRWLPSTQENAEGPHVHDPRTGEILNGSIRMFHNIMNITRAWYFTQVAPLDPRAAQWPMPDSVMGRLIQYVVTHEVGHTLGLMHNFKSSSLYPVDSLRSVTWLRRMGHVASIMDYSRFNYVAQPEDKIPVDLLVPNVGPADRYAIMWGYAPISTTRTPDDERPQLDRWARIQDSVPWYRFGSKEVTGGISPDVGENTEAVGDADAVKATTLGVKNLQRVMQLLPTATTRAGNSYTELSEMYARVVQQWRMEMSAVVSVIGGAETQMKYTGQSGPVYTPVSRARQVAAMRFLNANAFTTPHYLLDAKVLQRISADGNGGLVSVAQQELLKDLFATPRINRMIEARANARTSRDVYTVNDMLSDLRRGLWSELSHTQITIEPARRRLQRAFVMTAARFLASERETPSPQMMPSVMPAPGPTPQQLSFGQLVQPSVPTELIAGMRMEFMALESTLAHAISRTGDSETRAHVLDALARVRQALKNS